MTLDRYTSILRKVHPQLAQYNEELTATIADIYSKIGSQPPQKVDSVQPQAPSTPPAASFSVTSNNGVYQVQIVNPQDVIPASMKLRQAKVLRGPNAPLTALLHNVQAAADTNFSSASGLIDYGVTSNTLLSIPNKGTKLYWRFRSSFDGQNWNGWQIFAGPSGPIAVNA